MIIDYSKRRLWIRPEVAKNGKGWYVQLDNEMIQLLKVRHVNCEYVFHRDGRQIKDFRFAWSKACDSVGLNGYRIRRGGKLHFWKDGRPVRTFHSLRRTAVRRLVRSGVSETVAKKITGHLTSSIFQRYDIVSDEDLQVASDKLENYSEECDVSATL